MTRKLESAIGSVQKISGSVQRNRHYPPAAASSCAQLDIIRRFFEVSNWKCETLGFHLLAQFTAPSEKLRGDHAVPPSNGADGLLAGVALRNDRDLDLRWPIPTLARAGEDLEPLNPASASIVT